MNEISIKNEILHCLYEAFFLSESDPNLKKFAEEKAWSKTPFWNLIKRMCEDGLIENAAMGGFYRITGSGVIHSEETGIAPEELAKNNQSARTKILLALVKVYEEKGNLYTVYNPELYEAAGVDRTIAKANLLVLLDLGYAESSGNAGSKLTSLGRDAVEEYRKTRALADEFERISGLSPHARGRALQNVIATIIERHGWEQDQSVKTTNEEMDVLIFRDREYYLLESKWGKDSTEAAVVRELFGKLSNRIDVRGIVASMSGFSKGAVQQVHDYSGQRIILLFGRGDLQALAYGQTTFDELLNHKYRALVTKRIVEFS